MEEPTKVGESIKFKCQRRDWQKEILENLLFLEVVEVDASFTVVNYISFEEVCSLVIKA